MTRRLREEGAHSQGAEDQEPQEPQEPEEREALPRSSAPGCHGDLVPPLASARRRAQLLYAPGGRGDLLGSPGPSWRLPLLSWSPSSGSPGLAHSHTRGDSGETAPAGHVLNPCSRQSFSLRILPTKPGTRSTGRGRLGLRGCTRV